MILLTPAIQTTVQSVSTAILVGRDVVVNAVDIERAVLDTVCVTSGDTAKVRVNGVFRVVGGIVVPEDNVALYAIFALDEQVRNGRAIWDEQPADAVGRDLVLAILIRSRSGVGRVIGRSCNGSCREQC